MSSPLCIRYVQRESQAEIESDISELLDNYGHHHRGTLALKMGEYELQDALAEIREWCDTVHSQPTEELVNIVSETYPKTSVVYIIALRMTVLTLYFVG